MIDLMTAKTAPRSSTGIAGLDEILMGGLPSHRFYLVQGDPGVGKTTLGLQFLLAGDAVGEKGLYITLSETHDELIEVANSHQWDLSPISIFELSAIEQTLAAESQNTLFHPAEVELNQIAQVLMDKVAEVNPVRVIFDSLSELRLLAQNPLRYRRQLLSLKQFFAGRKCTVVVMDDRTSESSDREVQSIAHGVIKLEHNSPKYGDARRRITVVKVRGSVFRGGYHDYVITRGGLVVFPRLSAGARQEDYRSGDSSSGIPSLDNLLCGGLDLGSSTLFMGPPGTGKSTLSAQFASAAAARGERAVIFTFDEKVETYVRRADLVGMRFSEHIAEGRIEASQINPAVLSPGEFANRIVKAVEERQAKVVVIDSLNGYLNSMPEESFLAIQMHELLSYLAQKGVVTILVLAQNGLIGAMQAPVDITYLADSVVILRYFEAMGEVKKAISVIKKRSGQHEKTIREFGINSHGLQVGEPLASLHGVLTGVPTFLGDESGLMKGMAAHGRS
ncbi:MAG TPA: ATPase domain-containing protein [Chthoniobacterales bacterium]|jgi:circadian clock protein KaiC